MTRQVSADDQETHLYDISAVSRLTGLSTPNLRMWEKRYGLVSPKRSKSQRRLYSEEDIRRLTLLKNLVDRGHPIGSIAGLGIDELERRLHGETLQPSADRGGGRRAPCGLLVIGANLCQLLEEEDSIEGTRILGRWEDFGDARREAALPRADLVIVECPTLFLETVREVQDLVKRASAQRAIVVYRFAQSKTAGMLDKDIEGITAIRAPVDLHELQLACRAEAALVRSGSKSARLSAAEDDEAPADIPPRLFSEAELARITRISSTVECECPRHLASLLASLAAFEQYSLECEDRSPEDAAVHAALHRATAKARHTMERALRDLMLAEGIELP